jgi:hypothetical protein
MMFTEVSEFEGSRRKKKFSTVNICYNLSYTNNKSRIERISTHAAKERKRKKIPESLRIIYVNISACYLTKLVTAKNK